MSDPSPWIRADYDEYVIHYQAAKLTGGLPPWVEPLDFEKWLSRQTISYLRGTGRPIDPVW